MRESAHSHMDDSAISGAPSESAKAGIATLNVPHAGGTQLNKNSLIPWLLQITAMIGIAILLYPQAANWFAILNHDAEVSAYIREVESMQAPDRLNRIQEARDYNFGIPVGLIRDPYINPLSQFDLSKDRDYQRYLEVMELDENGVIGDLSYPELGISLPIYNGTTDDVLKKGIGHLYGSSLPVGGESSHSVMTSHSGLVNANLFTGLLKAEVGDTFTVSGLGETLHYQVRTLETVLPEETDSLRVIDGEDWITLITCTPVGVNSHRLLVQAQRIETPPSDGVRAIAGDGITAGFPWWATAFVGGSGIVAYLIFNPRGSKRVPRGRHRLQEPRLRQRRRKQNNNDD